MKDMYPFWIVLALFFVAWFIRRTISKKYRPTETRPKLLKACAIAHIIHLIITPFMITFIIELASNRDPELLRPEGFFAGIMVCYLLEAVLVFVVPFFSMGMAAMYILAIIFGVVNEYVLRFRDIPFMLMDLLDASTMGGVAESYDMSPSVNAVLAFALTMANLLLIFALSGCFRKWMGDRFSYRKCLIVGASSALAMLIIISNVNFSEAFGIELNLWRPGNTYAENGAVSSFVGYAQFSVIGEPNGYSKEEVRIALEEAADKYDSKYGDTESDIKPTVIDIMDESFTDYRIMGLKCPEKNIDFFLSLKDNPGTIWQGYTYVSTYAGGTARSEFEYLTGYSMSFFPNCQPYSQFNFSDIATSVANMEAQGYSTIAMHPENPTNYRRNSVYDQMGFDTFYYYATFEGYEMSDLIPSRVADWGDFHKMIDVDNESDEPQMFHNVTMQNHGGYEFEIPKEKQAYVDSQYKDRIEIVDFQSLLTRTDDALEGLINNYSILSADKPTIICFFGDHQPRMPEDFVEERKAAVYDESLGTVGNEEIIYKVPFLIWANFDVDEFLKPYNFRGETSISQNYLGVVTRALSGLELSAFDKFLVMLREEIPVLNESGYIAGGEWHSHDEENEYTELIKLYEKIQYAGMFDNEGLEDLFYLEGE